MPLSFTTTNYLVPSASSISLSDTKMEAEVLLKNGDRSLGKHLHPHLEPVTICLRMGNDEFQNVLLLVKKTMLGLPKVTRHGNATPLMGP